MVLLSRSRSVLEAENVVSPEVAVFPRSCGPPWKKMKQLKVL